jgi:hypothetical protein
MFGSLSFQAKNSLTAWQKNALVFASKNFLDAEAEAYYSAKSSLIGLQITLIECV